ncbi:hypothetical protein AZE42_13602, partial [Rhizopogon vesiculosus]
MKSSAHH